MPPLGFKPTIPVGERRQTYALDRAATATEKLLNYRTQFSSTITFRLLICLSFTTDK